MVLENPQHVPVRFRDMVPEIPSTTYGTFAVYKYPAKFIPQVVAFTLKKYGKIGMRVFDPYAGHGTTGLVARIYGFDYELWDLNPLLQVIHAAAITPQDQLNLSSIMKKMRRWDEEFIPEWSNLEYWMPSVFLPTLAKIWSYIHSLKSETRNLLLVPMLKVTRYFSWSDHKIHKLYKSKFARVKVKQLLSTKWKPKLYHMLEKEISLLLRKIREYKRLKPKPVNYRLKEGIDVLQSQLKSSADILITSPPYLQAQEYIRSTKLELFWLGYKEALIRKLSRMEIPYGQVEKIRIHSETFFDYRNRIEEPHLLRLFDAYFHGILRSFSNLGEKITSYLCIFVGPAKIRGIRVPIAKIITEHLSDFGWKHKLTYIDRIVARVMFQTGVNPASGLKDERMRTEHLVVLNR